MVLSESRLIEPARAAASLDWRVGASEVDVVAEMLRLEGGSDRGRGGEEREETTPAIGERVGGTGIGAAEALTGFPFKNEMVSDSLAAES